MSSMMRWLVGIAFGFHLALAFANLPNDWQTKIGSAVSLRQQGELRLAIDMLSTASRDAIPEDLRFEALGELGITLLQAHQGDLAEEPLRQAHAFFSKDQRGRFAFYLGNLFLLRKNISEANRFYSEAIGLSDDKDAVRLRVRLNQLRYLPKDKRGAELHALSAALENLTAIDHHARYHLNLGNSARQIGETGLAYRHLVVARRMAEQLRDKRLEIETIDALAQLYENAGRSEDALNLSEQGIVIARTLDRSAHADLLISLEARMGRLSNISGKPATALAAYLRAIELIELVRQDIPIEYEDGQSSFRATLEPIYLGYADLMLRQLDTQPADQQQKQLRSIVDTIELVKQTEMQDFLGDRCAVEAVQGGSAGKLAAGTAVLYPLLLPDRLELLLETSNTIHRHVQPVKPGSIRTTATLFANTLRNGNENYVADSRQLYQWLLAPLENALSAEAIKTLIVIPDGVLRLVPVGALHDGRQFAIEKYAISTATGLSMTNSAPPPQKEIISLLAGVSEPGDVVEKLTHTMKAQILDPATWGETSSRGLARASNLRTIRSTIPRNPQENNPQESLRNLREIEELKQQLALPGVKDEIEALADILRGPKLLNDDFSIRRFHREIESSSYQILHIASHGVFGGSAETSFIMAHDDILTMNGLQSMLRSEVFQKSPLELLSLSACQTAEGNDRSPLGLSGAAIKARAKSVLGTLWPVEDNAAKRIMEQLYSGLNKAKLSKTESLRQAQISLIQSPETAHPFYWAPFVLIGNWQ